jgi:hypothetical protein
MGLGQPGRRYMNNTASTCRLLTPVWAGYDPNSPLAALGRRPLARRGVTGGWCAASRSQIDSNQGHNVVGSEDGLMVGLVLAHRHFNERGRASAQAVRASRSRSSIEMHARRYARRSVRKTASGAKRLPSRTTAPMRPRTSATPQALELAMAMRLLVNRGQHEPPTPRHGAHDAAPPRFFGPTASHPPNTLVGWPWQPFRIRKAPATLS